MIHKNIRCFNYLCIIGILGVYLYRGGNFYFNRRFMIYLLRQYKDEQIMIDKLLVLCRELKEGNFDNRIIYVKTKN